MTSREIAELTGVRHDNAVVVIKDLVNKGTIKLPEIQEVSTGSRGPKAQVYLLDRRSSLLLAGRLSVDFMATVFDRWDELEKAAQAGTLAAPRSPPNRSPNATNTTQFVALYGPLKLRIVATLEA